MKNANWRFWGLGACVGALSIVTGCASVTHGTSQPVKIDTLTTSGERIQGAECRIKNDRGGESITLSGQSAQVRRSAGDLSVDCTHPGQPPAQGRVVSHANVGIVGNVLIGGVVGAVVDASTGAGFSYPDWLQLVFGEVRLFEGWTSGGQAMAGVVQSQTQVAAAAASTPAVQAAAPAALASIDPMDVRAPLRRGDILEYELRDELTGNQATVQLRLDRIEGEQMVFNMGGRVERKDGTVISIGAPAAGMFDASSPPEGWVSGELRPGHTWSTQVPQINFNANVVGEEMATIEGQSVRVLRIQYDDG